MEVVKWLCENIQEYKVYLVIDEVIKNGHLELVKYLYKKNNNEWLKKNVMEQAIESNQLEITKWLCITDKKYITFALSKALKNKKLEIIEFICQYITNPTD